MLSLPTAAEDILDRIKGEDDRATAENRRHASERQALQREKAVALEERARLAEADARGELIRETHGHDSKGRSTLDRERDPRRIKQADAKIASLDRKISKLDAAASQFPRLTATRIQHQLAKHGPRAEFVAVDRPKLPLGKNERPVDAIHRLRDNTLSLIAEHAVVSKAPRALAEVQKAARTEINKLADSGLPKTLRMFNSTAAGIEWATRILPQRAGTGNVDSVPDGIALVAFLLREKLIAEVDKLLTVNASAFPDALTTKERTERLAELEAAIDHAGRVEATCVEAILEQDGDASHRHDANVLAVLSLRLAD